MHPRFVIKHASMGKIKRVKTRHKQGQESNKGVKERGWGLQKGGQKCQKSYITKEGGKKDVISRGGVL